jgi:hypothetical protein
MRHILEDLGRKGSELPGNKAMAIAYIFSMIEDTNAGLDLNQDRRKSLKRQ